MFIKLSYFKALTLIEVLITIVVFSSGILVILSVITNSLSLGSRTRNRTTATMLAKEGLEMVYSMRDTSLDKAESWWCVVRSNGLCDATYNFSGSQTYFMTIVGSGSQGIVVNEINTNLSVISPQLYISTGDNSNSYVHSDTGYPSIFYRYISVAPVAPIAGQSTDSFTNSQIKKIESHVYYMQLWGTGEVVLESLIWYTRQ